MIKLSGVSKSYDAGQTFSVRNVSLDVQDGETLVLLGASGSGKTTLLKMINRLILPSSGKIEIDDRDTSAMSVVELRRSIGYVFQKIGLFPHMTIAENISIVLRLTKRSLDEQCERAHELLEAVNLDPEIYADRYPNELSGGQQQRAGVARALASNPRYLLMDEPFGALDAINRDALQQELRAIRSRLNKTIIFVTHDIFEACLLGDRIAVMNKGCLEQVGSRDELIESPASQYVEQLFAMPQQQIDQFSG